MKKINTIAIIDDDDIYQYSAKKNIAATALANKVVSLYDGQEAIEFFTEHLENPEKLPDIVFLDLNMPITDGWQFLEQYAAIQKKIKKDITIYITSSSMNPDDLIQARNISEVSDYIIKPITLDKFKELLEK
ncbi:MAG: response regulator [Maribacter sp.]|jgi:CheY-like chemotaxis protein